MALPAIDFTALGQDAATAVRAALLGDAARGRGETLLDPRDLKSGHTVDDVASAAVRERIGGHDCNVYIEGETSEPDPEAAFCLYIDPVDGSLNWDRGIGDPAFVIAAAPGPAAACLDDLAFVYVEGLRTGDRYSADGASACYIEPASGERRELRCNAPDRVEAATAYLRCGYGGARRQLEHSLALMLAARDVRAFDNAATELADIARGSADFMVEARGISDGFNLLAYPLLRAAGATLVDLDGEPLAGQPFDPLQPRDYVAAGSDALARAVVDMIARSRAHQRSLLQALADTAGS